MNNKEKAVIFDMDGVLLDTEPLWGISMMAVAKKYQIPVTYADLKYTTGLRINEVTKFWKERFPWQDSTVSSDEIAHEILENIISNAIKNATIMPGVVEHINYLKSNNFQLGVATSSPKRMMDVLLKHFQLFDFFDATVSAESSSLGKPHPQVYLNCAESLNMRPYQCIAVEDSINGMIAAKSARMYVVAVPDADHYNRKEFGLADVLTPNLKELSKSIWQTLLQ